MFNYNQIGNTKIIVIILYKIKKEVNKMDTISLVLVIIGALNWGLVALFEFDLVASIFGSSTALLSRIVYGIIALAGVYCIKFLMDRDRDRKIVKE